MNKSNILALCMALCLIFGMSAAIAQETFESGLPSPFTYDSLAGLKGEEWAEAAIKKNAAVLSKYQAKRYTTANGVTVQKVPNDNTLTNIAIFDAEQRGCNSCHDLATALEWLPLSHPQLANEYDSAELPISMCYNCHPIGGGAFAGVSIADGAHALHLNSSYFTGMGGNCLSCHHIDVTTGEYALWDDVKYNVMQGITTVSADEAVVEASYNQTELTAVEDVYIYFEGEMQRGIPVVHDQAEEIWDNWTIEINGDIEQPVTISWKDFYDKYSQYSVTYVSTMHCLVDGLGANQIANVEVTGIPMKYLLEEVGYVEEEGTFCALNALGADGMEWVDGLGFVGEDTMLVYEMYGEKLPARLGYPVRLWIDRGTTASWVNSCQPVRITLMKTEGEPNYIYPLELGALSPNCGILNYRDGQVFQMGDEIVFEGHAHGYFDRIDCIEYSLDLGQTWIKLDTTDSEIGPWVYWYLKIEPQTIGSYVLQVRAMDDKGRLTPGVVQSLFHVE